jgi:hypothetical protein
LQVGDNGTCGHERGGSRIWADKPNENLCEPANTDGIDPGCGSKNVWIHDVFIENGDDSIVMKPGWGFQKEGKAGCTRDILVENVTIYRGMGANIGGMGDGCVDNVTFRDITLDHPSLAGIEIKTEHGPDNESFISNVLYENIVFKESINASCCPCVSITAQYGGPGACVPDTFIFWASVWTQLGCHFGHSFWTHLRSNLPVRSIPGQVLAEDLKCDLSQRRRERLYLLRAVYGNVSSSNSFDCVRCMCFLNEFGSGAL